MDTILNTILNEEAIAIILSVIAINISVFVFIYERKDRKTLEALSLLPNFFLEYK